MGVIYFSNPETGASIAFKELQVAACRSGERSLTSQKLIFEHFSLGNMSSAQECLWHLQQLGTQPSQVARYFITIPQKCMTLLWKIEKISRGETCSTLKIHLTQSELEWPYFWANNEWRRKFCIWGDEAGKSWFKKIIEEYCLLSSHLSSESP